MSSKKKYSIRKVSVGTASILIGIAAGSLGTVYAHEDANNVVINAEANHDVNLEHVNKPVLEEVEKPMPKPELAPKPKETPAEAPVPTLSVLQPNKEDRVIQPSVEDKVDWELIKEKQYLKYSLENIIDVTEKERLVNNLWAAKSKEDIERIRLDYEAVKKSEEKQKELEEKVYSLKRLHNLYISGDKDVEFTKEVAAAKNDNELNRIINKYKLEELKKELTNNYDYRNIPREEINSANSIEELNNLKENYRLPGIKEDLVTLLNRTSEFRRDENTDERLPLLSIERKNILLKEVNALKSEEKAKELKKLIETEQEIIYKREEAISRIKYHLTDLTDEQLVPFVNELEKYTTEADLKKVKDKIEAEDKKLREERIKKEQANILDVLNTKAKLNDYEKEKLKQEMVELYRDEYEVKSGKHNFGIYDRKWEQLKYEYVGKSNSEFLLLKLVGLLENVRNNENLSDEVKKKYIDKILKEKRNEFYDLIRIEELIFEIEKSTLSLEDKRILNDKARILLNKKENNEPTDRDALWDLSSTFKYIENIDKVSEIPSDIKKIMKNYLFRDETSKSIDFELRDYKNYYSLKNKIFSLTSVPKELTVELKRLLDIVLKEEIEPITNRLISEISNKAATGKVIAAIPRESKLSQLTTKVESLEKLYSYTRIPEYKLIKFRDEMLDASSSEEVRNTLATARAVQETLEILGYNGNYPKVEDRLKDKKATPKEEKITEDKKENKESVKDETKKVTPKEEKVTETRKENKEPAKAEDKKDNKESVKETDKKEVPKGQTVPENKQEVPSKETPKVTSDKTDSSNNKKQETSDKTDSSNNKKQETSENNAPVENKVLSATLSGRDVAVSFDKNKIKADDVFVGAINDEKLNKAIIEKLGSEYKVVEVFEIHFKKDGKKIDSDAERTVKVSVVKNDNAELEVYHIADNNVLEKVESSFSAGSLQFKINHFSKFTILERIRVGAKDLESRVQIVTPAKADYKKEEHKNENSNNNVTNSNTVEKEASKKDKEELPKTGLESEQTISMALLALVAAIVIRRKQKQ